MPDCVLDATVVHLSNGNLAARKRGNAFDRRLTVIEQTARGIWRLRYNPKLRGEYERLIREYRNDVIEVFFFLLDSDRTVFVKRNSLTRQQHDTARRFGWPSHDQHLLAAAIGGDDSTIFVTEARHIVCRAEAHRHFGVHLEDLG